MQPYASRTMPPLKAPLFVYGFLCVLKRENCLKICFQMGSVGALLDHLTKVRAVGELDDGGISGLEIRDIEYIALKQAMQINADALFSLQIFDTENHASAHSDKTKEGLSLFGILNNTKTSLGRAMLREWLLRPSLSIPVIEERHDAVACFIRPENLTIVTSIHGHLLGIKNVPKTMEAMKSGKVKISDWQAIMKVRSACASNNPPCANLQSFMLSLRTILCSCVMHYPS